MFSEWAIQKYKLQTSKYPLECGVRWMPRNAAWHEGFTEPTGQSAYCKLVPIAGCRAALFKPYTKDTLRTSSQPGIVVISNILLPFGNYVPDVSIPKTCRALFTGRVVDVPFNHDCSGGCKRLASVALMGAFSEGIVYRDRLW